MLAGMQTLAGESNSISHLRQSKAGQEGVNLPFFSGP